MENWLTEIEEMMSITSENLYSHYEFVKRIGLLLEENGMEMNQILVMNDIIQNSFYNDEIESSISHSVFMNFIVDEINNVEISFPFNDGSPQLFEIRIIKVNAVSIDNFMGISIYKPIFNDSNLYFDKLLINIIYAAIKTADDYGIY
jgi:hypothetical protein